MKEKIVIIFIALIIGLLITTVGFYVYQSTKVATSATPEIKQETTVITTPTTAHQQATSLFIDEPKDEAITARRTIQVKGKTSPANTILVSTNSSDAIGTPASDGTFSVTVDIDAGVNKLIVRAIDPSGNETSTTQTITFSTDEF